MPPALPPLPLGRLHPGGGGCPGVTRLDQDIQGPPKAELLQGYPVPAGLRLPPYLESFYRI